MIDLPLKRSFSVPVTGGIGDEDELLVNAYLTRIGDSYPCPMGVTKEILI